MATDWYKCQGGVWCNLFKLDLNHKYITDSNGAFVIWTQDKETRNVLRVGSGNISEELSKVKKELAFQAFSHLGLLVAWTELSQIKRAGVELYLINTLKPKMQKNKPNAIAIKVDLPWD